MRYDVAVIGSGIAGASLAAELAPHASVLLLEAEEFPGYHSTGRSAAFWHETLGGPLVRPLSVASLQPLRDGGFLTPRPSLNVAFAADLARLDALEASFAGSGARLRRLDHEGVRRFVPRATRLLVGGVLEQGCGDIDVGGLLNQYIAAFRRAGGTLVPAVRVDRLSRQADHWDIGSAQQRWLADTVVDAAGAWVDQVALLAGARPVGLQPMRRTIVQVRVDGNDVPPDLPLTIDIGGSFYFRPQGPDRLWLCPHDETPVDPGDVAPEEIDVAIAIDRFETATDWRVVAVERKWAGLRTFAPDRLPVFGFDAMVPGFFWCAGQGGVGIQTAPAAARMCAGLILGGAMHASVADIDAVPFWPGRFVSGPNA